MVEQRNRVEDLISGIAEALAVVGDSRDPYTANHQRSVACISRNIGEDLGLIGGDLYALFISGLLHDVGKISIPLSILIKPGPLTSAEYNMVKEHPQAGYDILKRVPFPFGIATVALQHHERLDGGGYPFGLVGDSIMEISKIVAVADVLDAMVSSRSYRIGCSIKAALSELTGGAGILYDREVVYSCVKLSKMGILFRGTVH